MAKILDLSLILDRLKTTLVGFKTVGESADLDLAIDSPMAAPAAFVLPLAESATHVDMTGGTQQRITQLFGVVLCVSNRRDARGAAALTDLNALRLQVRAALVGWIPEPAQHEPVHYVAGRLMKMDGDGRLWWLDDFELKQLYWTT